MKLGERILFVSGKNKLQFGADPGFVLSLSLIL